MIAPARVPALTLLARARGAAARSGLAVLLLVGLAICPSSAAVDVGTWIVDGSVRAILPAGDVVYVGGRFDMIGPATGSGVPISTDTFTPVPEFPRVLGTVSTVDGDGAGGWYIGGTFTHVGGLPRQNLAHVAADHSVSDWAPNTNGEVLALLVTPADVVVGGTFTTVNGLSRPRLAKVSRATGQPSAWTPAPSDQVTELVSDGTTLYVGGRFTLGSRGNLVAFDLATNALTSWNPAAGGEIFDLELANGYLYVAGSFHTIGGQNRKFAAAVRLDDAQATAWGVPDAENLVTQLLPIGDRVIVGGMFMSLNLVSRFGIAAVDTSTGSLLPWNPGASPPGGKWGFPDGSMTVFDAFEEVDGRVAMGGFFEGVSRAFANGFAVIETTQVAAAIPAPQPLNVSTRALARQGNRLFVGGQFQSLGASRSPNLAAVDVVSGLAIPWSANATSGYTGWPFNLATVTALAADPERVFAAVTFTDPVTTTRTQLRAFSRSSGATLWQDESDLVVNALAANGGRVYAGGTFSYLAGAAQRLAAVNAITGVLQSWAPAPNNTVRSLLIAPGGLVVGGDFTNLGGQLRSHLGQVDESTGNATPWDPGADQSVRALASSGTTILAGGDFLNAGGQPRSRVAALDLLSNDALPWNPGADGSVRALATDGANVYAGGMFATFAGQPAARFAGVTLASGLPIGWGASANATIHALGSTHQRVYAGGEFTMVDTEGQRGLAGLYDPTLLEAGPPLPAPPAMRLAVGPSPLRSSGHARFVLDRAQSVSLRVLDITGRVAWTLLADEPLGEGRHEIPIERTSLAPGVYHLQLVAGSTRSAARFIILP